MQRAAPHIELGRGHVRGILGRIVGQAEEGLAHLRGIDGPSDGVQARLREAQPVVELRVPFTVDRQQVDAVERGAKDADWQPVKDAAQQMAYAEDHTIFEIMESLNQAFPRARKIGLGHQNMPSQIISAMKAGASDFLDRDASPQEIRDTIIWQLNQVRDVRGERAGQVIAVVSGRENEGESEIASNLANIPDVAQGAPTRVEEFTRRVLVTTRQGQLRSNALGHRELIARTHRLRRAKRALDGICCRVQVPRGQLDQSATAERETRQNQREDDPGDDQGQGYPTGATRPVVTRRSAFLADGSKTSIGTSEPGNPT